MTRYISVLMDFLRSIIGHVMGSTRAQSLLDWIAKMIHIEKGDDPTAATGSLSSLHRAPQCWLSDVVPLTAIVTRVGDLLMYFFALSQGLFWFWFFVS